MDEQPTLNEHLMASGFVLQAFMVQVSLELAREKDDPGAWARSFVNMLTERGDANEARHPSSDDYPVHELARGQIDKLGAQLERILASTS